jgi:hypothetical protein
VVQDVAALEVGAVGGLLEDEVLGEVLAVVADVEPRREDVRGAVVEPEDAELLQLVAGERVVVGIGADPPAPRQSVVPVLPCGATSKNASRSDPEIGYFFAIFGRSRTSEISSICFGARTRTNLRCFQASSNCAWRPRVERRLLTS